MSVNTIILKSTCEKVQKFTFFPIASTHFKYKASLLLTVKTSTYFESFCYYLKVHSMPLIQPLAFNMLFSFQEVPESSLYQKLYFVPLLALLCFHSLFFKLYLPSAKAINITLLTLSLLQMRNRCIKIPEIKDCRPHNALNLPTTIPLFVIVIIYLFTYIICFLSWKKYNIASQTIHRSNENHM